MEKENYKKVVVVNQVKFPKEDKSEKDLYTNELVSSLLSEMESLNTNDDSVPVRDLKKIKHDRDAKTLSNLVDLNNSPKDKVTIEDLEYLKNADPSKKIEALEIEFFTAQQQILKNIRTMETLKVKMFKLYQEIYPNLSAETIQEKFKY